MAKDAILQVKESFTATLDGAVVYFRQGELVDSEHPCAKKYPQYFGAVQIQHPWRSAPAVEQATAAPGEKRGK